MKQCVASVCYTCLCVQVWRKIEVTRTVFLVVFAELFFELGITAYELGLIHSSSPNNLSPVEITSQLYTAECFTLQQNMMISAFNGDFEQKKTLGVLELVLCVANIALMAGEVARGGGIRMCVRLTTSMRAPSCVLRKALAGCRSISCDWCWFIIHIFFQGLHYLS